MWAMLASLLGNMLGGGQQDQDPMAGYGARMQQGMGQTPQYPGQQPPGAGLDGAGQQQGGTFNQGFGVDRQKWEMMQALARQMNAGGGGQGGGYGGAQGGGY